MQRNTRNTAQRAINKTVLLIALLGFLLPISPAAHAQLSLLLTQGRLAGSPGDMLTFYGTFHYNGNTGDPTLYLNDIDVSFSGAPLTIDKSLFTSNNVPATLEAGDTFSDIPFIGVNIDNNATPGTYNGTIQILGGYDQSANNPLLDQAVPLQVTVNAVPESGSQIYIMVAAPLLLVLLKRRQAERSQKRAVVRSRRR